MKKSSSVTLLGCGDGAKELKFSSLDDLAFKEVIGNLADLVNVGAGGGGGLLALFFRNLTGPSSSEGETAGEGRDGGVLDGVGCLKELSRTCFGEVSLACVDLGLILLGSLTSTSFSLIDFLFACCIEVDLFFVAAITKSLVVGFGELKDLTKLVRLACFTSCLLFRPFDFRGESGAIIGT